jgi:hypothetical protein
MQILLCSSFVLHFSVTSVSVFAQVNAARCDTRFEGSGAEFGLVSERNAEKSLDREPPSLVCGKGDVFASVNWLNATLGSQSHDAG